MWGFDFTKQAEELKKQAEAAAASTSWAPTSLFNLDAFQKEEEQRTSPTNKKVPDHERPVASGDTNANNNNTINNPRHSVTSTTVSATPVVVAAPLKKPMAPAGKLKIPVVGNKSTPSASAKTLSTPSMVLSPLTSLSAVSAAVASISPLSAKSEKSVVTGPSPAEKKTDATAVASVPPTVQDNVVLETAASALSKDESDGGGNDAWNEDEENLDTVDIDGETKPSAPASPTQKPSSSPSAAVTSQQSAAAASSVSQPPAAALSMSPAEKSVPESEDDVEDEEEDSDDDYAPPPPPGILEQQTEENTSSLLPQHSKQEINGQGTSNASTESIHVGEVHEDDTHSGDVVAPPGTEDEPKDPSSQVQGEGQQVDSGAPTKKLLILCSNQSLNRKAFKLQENCFTILTARKVPYETIDGSDLRLKEWRNELMALSGSREYPQFFLLDIADGSTAFWGNYERFEFCNDEGTLFDELTGRRATQLVVHADGGDEEDDDDDDDDEANTDDNHEDQAGDEETEPVNVDTKPSSLVPEAMLQQFSEQLKRIEENHQAEITELERKHEREIQQTLQSLNHDDCEAQMMKMEEALTAKIQQKEEQLHHLYQVNEGYKLKVDSLKREVEGKQALLEGKESDIAKVSALHNRDLKVLGQQLQDAEDRANKARLEIEQLKRQLESTKEDLAASRREHEELKQRVKSVASELKDRRQECRDLSTQVEELTDQKDRLQADLDRLHSIVTSQDRNRSEKDEQIIELRSKLASTEVSLKKVEDQLKEHVTQNDKTMTEYKKKAQNSLALANSRTASAVQAKEEAEMEARAARLTADSAMERATRAEIEKREALAEAKVYVADMEREKNQVVRELQQVKDQLESVKKELQATQEQLHQANAISEELSDELREMMAKWEEEQKRATSMHEEFLQSQDRSNKLRDDVAVLREQLAEAELAARETKQEVKTEPKPAKMVEIENGQKLSDSETIRILQQELKDANAAIEDLKEALKNAVEGHSHLGPAAHNAAELNEFSDHSVEPSANGGKEASPLFYAMEKHAELKTARNEINRLANLLSDVQTEKMEAVDAMESMRQRMEEAESRLKRYEKLGVSSHNSDLERANGPTAVTAPNSGAVNIEYLKNIMLSYLNAKTLSERKALVPVIGAVLCLTEDEQNKALKNLEESLSLGGVGSSLFESLSGRLVAKK